MQGNQLLMGAAAGSALMFVLDPSAGRRRRALMRDQVARATRKTRDGLDATARDLANRTSGIAASTRSRWSDEQVSDTKLVERVRARLGRVCSHARAIDVEARDGQVWLRGPVLTAEVDDIVETVAAVRGVRSVSSELELHDTAEHVPSLQGGGQRAGGSLNPMRWSPTGKALLTAGLVATGVWMAVSSGRTADVLEDSYGAL